jgi:hypothetical protein
MTAEALVRQQASSTELVNLSEKDLAEVANFIAAQSGRSPEDVHTHLRWFLLENPARRPHDSLAIGLRCADELVGCILYSPQLFRLGTENIFFMGSSCFYVDSRYRGHGGRIFLQYCRQSKEFPHFGTSANADAAALWRASGGTPIPNSDSELFGVLRWPPVAEEFAHRKNANQLIRGIAGSSVANLAGLFESLKIEEVSLDALVPLTSAEQANDLTIQSPAPKLTAVRDLPYLHWRYFSGQDAATTAFAFHNRILVTVNQRVRGYRSQINTLNILDVYPEATVEEWLQIIGALIARYKKDIDAIVLRYQSTDLQEMFCEKGFRRRDFDAPIGWLLDKRKQLPANLWYIVPADGDGLI